MAGAWLKCLYLQLAWCMRPSDDFLCRNLREGEGSMAPKLPRPKVQTSLWSARCVPAPRFCFQLGRKIIPNYGSRALLIQQTCRSSFSAVSKPICADLCGYSNLVRARSRLYRSRFVRISADIASLSELGLGGIEADLPEV